MENETRPHPASFRDPSGSIFLHEGALFRKINRSYRDEFDAFRRSGLYERLVRDNLIVPHREVSSFPLDDPELYRIIQPERLPFISYPYEWCFSQLKDAALLTLQIQKTALEYGLTLKDASAYNVQYRRGKPVFIDTLSFERYQEGEPWVAYRQFCQHFLAPLAIISKKDVHLNQLTRIHLDGLPLALTQKLLPFRTRLSLSLFLHIHMHAKVQKKFSRSFSTEGVSKPVSKFRLRALIDSLETAVARLKWRAQETEWNQYEKEMHYSERSYDDKKLVVRQFLEKLSPDSIWDLGANTGVFSRIAAAKKVPVISLDGDPGAVEGNYLWCKANGERNILPLLMDFTNPSPATGWENRERASLLERGPADLVMALALVHHLAITNNLPLKKLADFFARVVGRWLIVEFVPKEDSWVRSLLASRRDIFSAYTRDHFEDCLKTYFQIFACKRIEGTERILYLLEKRWVPKCPG